MAYRTTEEGFSYPWYFPIGGSIFFPTSEDYSPDTEYSINSPEVSATHRVELSDLVYSS